jgi:hypothetical protein
MRLTADDYQAPHEDVQFCQRLAMTIPGVRALWEEHLREELGQPLPYMFLFTLALWAEERATAYPEDIRALVSALNDGLDHGVGDVPNLILAGFVESMSAGTALIPLVSGTLKPWVDYQFGLRATLPPPPQREDGESVG